MASPQWAQVVGTLAVAFAVYGILGYYRRLRARRILLPPGPVAWPVIGNLHHVGKLPHQTFQQLSEKYGPVIYVDLGSVPMVVVSSPELAKEVLKVQDAAFSSRPKTPLGMLLTYGLKDMVFSDVGPHFRLLRKISQFELLSASRVATYKNVRKEEIIATLKEIVEDSRTDGVVRMDIKLSEMLLNNITRMTVSTKYFGAGAEDSPSAKALAPMFKEIMECFGTFMPGEFLPFLSWMDIGGHMARLRTIHKCVDAFLSETVADRRKKQAQGGSRHPNEAPDFVEVMVGLSGPDKLTDEHVKAFFGDILVGASETSSNSLLWAMAELMRNPHIRQRVQDELNSVVGPSRLVEESDLPNLPYLQAVFKESLRLHPVGPLLIPHSTNQVTRVAGFQIPTGTRVLVNAYAIHRDSANWERPLEFDPERFLNSDIRGPAESGFRYLPFGYGRRVCPGMNLASLVVQFYLAQLLHACDWSLPPGMLPEDLDMSESFGATLPMKYPLRLVASPRLPFLTSIQCESTDFT